MRFARWLLARIVPADWFESIAGDLEEERRHRLASGRRAGPVWAVSAAFVTAIKLRAEDRRPVVQSHTRGGFHPGTLFMDVRLAVRSLRASPGFTAVALIVLALGVGATTAIFSVVDAALLRRLPFDQPDRLVAVGEVSRNSPLPFAGYIGSAARPNYVDWNARQHVFLSMGASTQGRDFTIRTAGDPEELQAQQITASLFDVLRVRPRIGRPFTDHDEIPGNQHIAIISDGLWRRRFGADPNVMGKTMAFDTGGYEVVGVMPPDFMYPLSVLKPTDLFVPYAPDGPNETTRTSGRNYNLRVVARLRDGVTVEQARTEVEHISAALAVEYPRWFTDEATVVGPLWEATVGRTRVWMLMLLGSVMFVLLIACVNVANLMLARATTRARETGIRAALGASRWQIARGLLIESLVLSAAGTLCALIVASWGVSVLRAALPATLPRIAAVGIDLRVLGVAALTAVVTGLLFGLAPAIQFSRPNLNSVLGEAGRSNMAGRDRQRLRSSLVVAEVALAVVLLVGAGLFVSSFLRLVRVDLGLDYRNVLTVGVNPRIDVHDPHSFDRARDVTRPIVADILERVQHLPGVDIAAAVSGGTPLSGGYRTNDITVPGHATFKDAVDGVQIREVTPDYAKALRLQIRRGRYIAASDTIGAPQVVVLNEEAVARYFGGRDPIGTIVNIDDADRLVVGVMANVRVRGPEVPIQPEAHMPFAQTKGIGATLVIRTTGDPMDVAPAVKQAVLASLPDVPVKEVTTLEASLRSLIALRKLNMLLVGLFGILAIIIAAAGIYGVMAFIVAQRTKEIGLRMALGALPREVLQMILGRALILMAIGLAIGLFGAWTVAGSVGAFLFDVHPHDPVVYLSVGLLLILAGLIAAFLPARRAARVDPMIALRAD